MTVIRTALALEPYALVDGTVLRVRWRKSHGVEFGANPMGNSRCSSLEPWREDTPPAAGNHTSFEKQLLVCYAVMAETECSTTGTKPPCD